MKWLAALLLVACSGDATPPGGAGGVSGTEPGSGGVSGAGGAPATGGSMIGTGGATGGVSSGGASTGGTGGAQGAGGSPPGPAWWCQHLPGVSCTCAFVTYLDPPTQMFNQKPCETFSCCRFIPKAGPGINDQCDCRELEASACSPMRVTKCP